MPSFVTTKADMILYGILPIDQMRDHKPPINTLIHRIPRYHISNNSANLLFGVKLSSQCDLFNKMLLQLVYKEILLLLCKIFKYEGMTFSCFASVCDINIVKCRNSKDILLH